MENTKQTPPQVADTCKARYERFAEHRQPFLNRARQCSELTIPTLIPPEGKSTTTKYYTPWQGLGARGVNNLASKLLLALLPPNAPFFKLAMDDFAIEKLAGEEGMRAKVEEALNKIERAVQTEVETSGLRNPVFTSLKHLIVGGNVCFYLPKNSGARVFPLDQYVVSRDPEGNVLEGIIKEEVSVATLDDDLLQMLQSTPSLEQSPDADAKLDKKATVEIYTRIYRDGALWKMYQELNGKKIPQSYGQWPIDKSPMMFLRWTAIEGEDYGRSYVEEYIGDLISLEGLSQAIVEASAVAAKIVFLVSPNGVTKAADITRAESGEAIVGQEQDVYCLQAEKQADLRIAYETIKILNERLSHAFLLNSAIQRQAERVTAEEIRFMAGELEDALGGVYSIFSQEFQLPLVVRIMDRMQKSNKLPKMPEAVKKVLKPTITTGLEALGRGHDLNKYVQFMSLISQIPEAAAMVNVQDLVTRVGTALMIDMKGLVKSEDQIMQERQQAMQMQMQQQLMDMAGKAAPQAVKAIGDRMNQQPTGAPAAPEQAMNG